MSVATMDELRRAVKAAEPEIVVADEALAKKVRVWTVVRMTANVLVAVVLIGAIFVWANPMRIPEFESGTMLLARRIALGVGVLLLFADFVIPVVRQYRIAGQDATGLKLVLRKRG
jgi:hypothetical protein